MVWPFEWNLFDSICFSVSNSRKIFNSFSSRVLWHGQVMFLRNKAQPVWRYFPANQWWVMLNTYSIKGIFPFWDWKRFFTESQEPKPSEEGVSYFVNGKLELKFIPWKMVHLNAKNACRSSTDSVDLPSFWDREWTPVSYAALTVTEEVQLTKRKKRQERWF